MEDYRTAINAPRLPCSTATQSLSKKTLLAIFRLHPMKRLHSHQRSRGQTTISADRRGAVKVYELKGETWSTGVPATARGVYDETVDEALLVARRGEKCNSWKVSTCSRRRCR